MELSTGEKALQALRPVRVLHPMLLSLCPLFGLYAQNLDSVPASAVVRPALVLAGGALLLSTALTLVLRNRYKAGLVTSTLVVSMVVVWGILEDLISRAIPLYSTLPPFAFYILYVVVLLAALGFVVYEYRGNSKSLTTHLVVWAVVFGGGLLVAALVLSPMFGRRAAWLITAYMILTAYAVVVVLRYSDDFQVLTRSANWFSTILLGLYTVVIIYNWPFSPGSKPVLPDIPSPPAESATPSYPDIYFIALDGYGRADVLRTFYGYNSLPLEEAMKAKGFGFSGEATANYTDVLPALTSCLNLDYVHSLVPDSEQATETPARLIDFYQDNRLFRFLKQRGYRITAFSPGIQSLELHKPADQVLSPPRVATEFEMVLLNRTIMARIMEAIYYYRYGNPAAWGYSHLRQRTEFALEGLRKLPAEASDSPRFIYAFLPIPEPPYLFTREGGLAQPFGPGSLGIDRVFRGMESDYREAYLDQVSYLNKMLDVTTAEIVEKSKRPVCVVIASCRGARATLNEAGESSRERFATLTLARFPNGQGEGLPPNTSFVNLFRVTLNKVFGTDLPILPDLCLNPPTKTPFKKQPAAF